MGFQVEDRETLKQIRSAVSATNLAATQIVNIVSELEFILKEIRQQIEKSHDQAVSQLEFILRENLHDKMLKEKE